MFERKFYLNKIMKFIETDDIILLYWARQVWKTSLMKIIQDKYINWKSAFIDLEDRNYLNLFNGDFTNILEYIKSYFWININERFYLFIDEIQYLENPTSFLKYFHDNFKNIKLIVSWSSTLEIREKMKDSLVGRLLKFDIFPLNFEEFLLFKWKENLSLLVWKENKLDIINSEMKYLYEEFMIWWWYPKVVLAPDVEIKKIYLWQIVDLYIQKDIKDIWKIREIDKFNKLLYILASQNGNLININEISNTINIAKQTLEFWLFLLQNTFVIHLLKPFSWNIRSEITKMPKSYFIDSWVRNYILDKFEIDWGLLENVFINGCIIKENKVNFWRTQDKKEIDVIIKNIPYEIKLNYNWKSQTALNYFGEKYNVKWNIVTLEKKENSKYNIYYPWEI